MDANQAYEEYKRAGDTLLAAIEREFPKGEMVQFMLRYGQKYPSVGEVIAHYSDGDCRVRLPTGTVKSVHFTKFF